MVNTRKEASHSVLAANSILLLRLLVDILGGARLFPDSPGSDRWRKTQAANRSFFVVMK